MISRNLRHFRVFLALARLQSATQAAVACNISQPAVTQCMDKLEAEAGAALFERTRQGIFLTPRAEVVRARLSRAMAKLDAGLGAIAPRLIVTGTAKQLQALIAVAEARNVSLAARQMGLSQPTVQRAIGQLEREAGRALFERMARGMQPTRACADLVQAARLAFAEFDQIEADLAEFDGRDAGRIVIGALPLARSVLLPEALAAFRRLRRQQRITVLDGPYDDMLGGVRRGDIDVMIGALREPLPIDDVIQEVLFHDSLSIVARPDHPMAKPAPTLEDLRAQSWAVPRVGTPSRAQFDALFEADGGAAPESIIDCGSILLMRELLAKTDLLGCISSQQARAEIASALLVRLPVDLQGQTRPIGLTYRKGWVPTKAQEVLLDLIRKAGAEVGL